MNEVATILVAQTRAVPPVVPRPEMIAIAERYFSSYDADDVEQRLGLFAEDLVFEDPIGVVRATDTSGLRAFYDGMRSRGYGLSFVPHTYVTIGRRMLVDAVVTVTVREKGSSDLRLYLLLEVDEGGRIITFRTFFDEEGIVA